MGAAEEVMPAKYKESGKTMKADVICVDPPRKGCDQEFLKTVVDMKIPKIVYISCGIASLCRDINYLKENNYEVIEVTPVDLFSRTSHVECVVRLDRKG